MKETRIIDVVVWDIDEGDHYAAKRIMEMAKVVSSREEKHNRRKILSVAFPLLDPVPIGESPPMMKATEVLSLFKQRLGTFADASSRFDYVRYDEEHTEKQKVFKDACVLLELMIDRMPDGRAKSLALTKLEETYMWIGKMIRDDQVANGGNADDVPERGEAGLKSY